MEKFKSTLNGKEYGIRESARVADQLLQKLLIKAGLRPIDMYPGVDDNGRDIIVMLFLRKESQPYYQKWLDHTLADSLKHIEIKR